MPRAKGKSGPSGSSRQPSLPLTWPVPLEPQDGAPGLAPEAGSAQPQAEPVASSDRKESVASVPSTVPDGGSRGTEPLPEDSSSGILETAKARVAVDESPPASAAARVEVDATAGPDAATTKLRPEEVSVSSQDGREVEGVRLVEPKTVSIPDKVGESEQEIAQTQDPVKESSLPPAEPSEPPTCDEAAAGKPPEVSVLDTPAGHEPRSGKSDRLKVRRGGVRLGTSKGAAPPVPTEVDAEPPPQSGAAGDGSVRDVQPPVVQATIPEEGESTPVKGAEPLRGEPPSAPVPGSAQPKVVKLGDTTLSLGQTLVEARGACNLTLAQVTQKTLVPKEIIESLESDRIDRLPSAIYTRSHLAHLCEEYGVDKDPILADYDRQVASLGPPVPPGGELNGMVMTAETTESASKVQWSPAGRGPVHARRGPFSATMWLVVTVALLLIVLAMIALSVHQWQQRLAVTPSPGGAPTTGAAAGTVNLEDYVAPQQLPLKELPVPKK
ncbi:MAG: hypothetical protein A3K19_01485 [Lentisphaerae bacterium RIFOXYB12_FULL_65_16]|nr:MAG: hypothetical protein A3K18_22840 [Lentisphaerae bacterium RIFOXYA12_64_32]OGV92813.1 MAG: hypothetical protein A3K19_01485 [Lentisphaerae bacterium RIFOXYB12_FULL_65_16]